MTTFGSRNGDVTYELLTGLDALVQRIEQRIRFIRGEWFADVDAGTADVFRVLGRRDATSIWERIVVDVILSFTGEVTGVRNVTTNYDERTRRLNLQATVDTIHGSTEFDTTAG